MWSVLLTLGACDSDVDDPGGGDNTLPEVITTVALTFTPQGGGEALTFVWADPENDGSPVVDPITLADADDYDLAVSFLNALSSPAEDITIEVAAESAEHQLFFTGSAVAGPAAVVAHTYADTDVNGFPVGLENTIVTLAPGSGTFVVTLRHLPAEPDPVKTANLAEDAAANGVGSLPGDTDASVEFLLAVE